jgi:ribosome-binding protein aMBF1 (putative translation factor)
MKMPRTESVILKLRGPQSRKKEAVKLLKELGFKEEESVPWREAFPEWSDEDLPGVALAGARQKEGLSQRHLSRLTNIPQRHISEMENGKRPIGKKAAKAFAQALAVSYKIFL